MSTDDSQQLHPLRAPTPLAPPEECAEAPLRREGLLHGGLEKVRVRG